MAGGPRFGLQADLVLPGKCWIRVGAVCEEARGIEIPAPESESLAAPLPPWLLKPPCEFGWLLNSGLGAEAVGGGGGAEGGGSAESPHCSSPPKLEAGSPLACLPSLQNPAFPRSDPKVYETMV